MTLQKIYNNDKEVFSSEQKAAGIEMIYRSQHPSTSILPHKTTRRTTKTHRTVITGSNFKHLGH